MRQMHLSSACLHRKQLKKMCNAMQKCVLCEWPLKLCPNHDKAKSHSIWLHIKAEVCHWLDRVDCF